MNFQIPLNYSLKVIKFRYSFSSTYLNYTDYNDSPQSWGPSSRVMDLFVPPFAWVHFPTHSPKFSRVGDHYWLHLSDFFTFESVGLNLEGLSFMGPSHGASAYHSTKVRDLVRLCWTLFVHKGLGCDWCTLRDNTNRTMQYRWLS